MAKICYAIGDTICIGGESWCLPSAGFFCYHIHACYVYKSLCLYVCMSMSSADSVLTTPPPPPIQSMHCFHWFSNGDGEDGM